MILHLREGRASCNIEARHCTKQCECRTMGRGPRIYTNFAFACPILYAKSDLTPGYCSWELSKHRNWGWLVILGRRVPNQTLYSLSRHLKIQLGFDYLGFSVALCTRIWLLNAVKKRDTLRCVAIAISLLSASASVPICALSSRRGYEKLGKSDRPDPLLGHGTRSKAGNWRSFWDNSNWEQLPGTVY